uniref:Chromo domain-containing protein n=1 Tax=Rhabditophanes sp. KR3021 TaxID=114890 RepID=A0AC35UCD6_9BILA
MAKEFAVEKILDKTSISIKGKKIEAYHVLWLGYPLSDATWEPVSNLKHTYVAKEYEARLVENKKQLEGRKLSQTSHTRRLEEAMEKVDQATKKVVEAVERDEQRRYNSDLRRNHKYKNLVMRASCVDSSGDSSNDSS